MYVVLIYLDNMYVCIFVKSGASMAKVFLCCGFIPCDDKDRNYDFVAGGSNGVVSLLEDIRDHMFVCMHVMYWPGVPIQEGGVHGIRPGSARQDTVPGSGHRRNPRCVEGSIRFQMYVYSM